MQSGTNGTKFKSECQIWICIQLAFKGDNLSYEIKRFSNGENFAPRNKTVNCSRLSTRSQAFRDISLPI